MERSGANRNDRRYWRTLYAATHDIASSLNVEEVLNRLVRRVAEAMDVKAASLRLLAANNEILTQRTSYGLSDRYLNKGLVLAG